MSPLARQAELPASDHARFTFAGRVRLDRRAELLAKLQAVVPELKADSGDAELVLQAYSVWGRRAVDHLHGDFAFAIWDAARGTLFCARDRIGVRTLVYLHHAGTWWVSDSLAELLQVSKFSSQNYDGIWIADYLESGASNDPARSIYADVKRLVPGHTLSISAAGAAMQRYWQLELGEPLILGSSAQYLERFEALLSASLRDRLPTATVGVLLSGGLDSSTLAALSVELAGAEQVTGLTMLVCPERDPETAASAEVAAHLGIRHGQIDSGQMLYDPRWYEAKASLAEPKLAVTMPQAHTDLTLAMARDAWVWFYGEGPDNALTFEWRSYLRWLRKRGQWGRLMTAVGAYFRTKSLREWKTTLAVWSGYKSTFWPEPDVQWVRQPQRPGPASGQQGPSWRPAALANLRGPLWPAFLESLDERYAAAGIDWRHPYLDLRVLEFMLRTPPIPWARRKRLIRKAMAGRLPRSILRRDKTPLHHDLFTELLRRDMPPMPRKGARVEPYVAIDKLPVDPASADDPSALLRVAILEHWLKHHAT
jgi:asparagine synthase (glutamine-hydrolysing)